MKMLKLGALVASALAGTMLIACGPVETEIEADDPEFLTDGDPAKADALSRTSTFYKVRPDYRRCMFPMCGGMWVSRVNRRSTRCAGGGYAAECYVAEIDTSVLGPAANDLRNRSGVLYRGSIVSKKYDSVGWFGVLKATEAWLPGNEDATASGTFYRVRDRGIRCIASPCFSYHEAKLNSTWHTNLSGVNLSGVGAPPDVVQRAYEALSSSSLLVAGTNQGVPSAGPAGPGRELVATQFYLRWEAPSDCRSTGCGPGRYCTFCWVNYACIPEGAVC